MLGVGAVISKQQNSVHMIELSEFSETPGSAPSADLLHSGNNFRRSILEPELRLARDHNRFVHLSINHVIGLSTGFMREAFGGLIAEDGFTASELRHLLKIKGSQSAAQFFIKRIWRSIDLADQNTTHH